MAKKNKGIFGKKRSQEYTRIRNNVKNKLARIQKKYGVDESELIYIPDKKDFSSVKEFNEWTKDMKWFTSRTNKRFQYEKNEHGVVANKQELYDAKTFTDVSRKITEKINKEIEKKPFISNNVIRGTVKERRQMMAKPDTGGINQLNEFDFSKITSRRQFERKLERAEERADERYYEKRMETMKQNYINQVAMSFNSDADELVELMKGIPADDFYEMYNMFDEMDFAEYDSEGQYIGADEPSNHVSKLKSYVNRYYEKKLDFDLKGF